MVLLLLHLTDLDAPLANDELLRPEILHLARRWWRRIAIVVVTRVGLELLSLVATANDLVLVFVRTLCHRSHFSQRGWPGLPRSNINLLLLIKGLSFEVLSLRLAVG